MIRYPKHVWSPAGGWYGQPDNWKSNTAIISGVIGGITILLWTLSAQLEHREKMPDVRHVLTQATAMSGTDHLTAKPILPFEILVKRNQRARAGAKKFEHMILWNDALVGYTAR